MEPKCSDACPICPLVRAWGRFKKRVAACNWSEDGPIVQVLLSIFYLSTFALAFYGLYELVLG